MSKWATFLCSCLWLSGSVSASGAELPITRIDLFSSGVGYFQRDGVVEGEDRVELSFRAGQINDILKSMVLQDFDGGTISAVNYPTQQPLDRALRAFAIKLGDNPSLGQLLDRCRGSKVQVGGTVNLTGHILGVERRPVVEDEKSYTREYLNLRTDEGIRRVDLDSVREIKLLDARLNEELDSALGVLARNLDSEKKTVVVRFRGSDKRRVRIGYLLETPLWKTSYRLVLSKNDEPYLQGWANVENTTEEDWHNVRLSLVSGRPISFVQDLYTPLYLPRPEVRPELYASVRPQEYAGSRGGGGGRGASLVMDGAASESATIRPSSLRHAGISAGGFDLYSRGIHSLARTQEAGELFRCDIDMPVTLERDRAAMLPIVGADIQAEKLSIYNPAVHKVHPLNGLLLTNTSGLHLMQGPVTVFDENTYAGDARLPDLKPQEQRLVSYALDLGLAIDVEKKTAPTTFTSARISKGTLTVVRTMVDHRVYHLNNKLDRPRTLIIELPMEDVWELVTPREPYEKADKTYRFKTQVVGKTEVPYPVHFERVYSTLVVLGDVGLDEIRLYYKDRDLGESVRGALARVIEMRTALDRTKERIGRRESGIRQIADEQRRIRENMKALPRESDVFARYLRKLDEQETRIESLRAEIEALNNQADLQRKELEDYLASLEVG